MRNPGKTRVPRPSKAQALLDLDVSDLAARIFLPAVDDVVETRDVTLLVVGEFADHGLELLSGRDLRRDLLRVRRFGGIRSLLDLFHSRIAVERVGFRLELLCTEFF